MQLENMQFRMFFLDVLQLSRFASLISDYRQRLATENCHFFILIS